MLVVLVLMSGDKEKCRYDATESGVDRRRIFYRMNFGMNFCIQTSNVFMGIFARQLFRSLCTILPYLAFLQKIFLAIILAHHGDDHVKHGTGLHDHVARIFFRV